MGGWFTFTNAATALFLLYVAHSIHQFYVLFTPPLCASTAAPRDCYKPFVDPGTNEWPRVQLRVYVSASRAGASPVEILRLQDIDLHQELVQDVNVSIPASTRRNGTLYATALFLPNRFPADDVDKADWHVVQSTEITTYQTTRPVSHLRTLLPLSAVADPIAFDAKELPGEIGRLMHLHRVSGVNVYLPLLYIDELRFRTKDLKEITPDLTITPLTISYRPLGIGKLRLLAMTEHSLRQFRHMGFNEKDVDDVKGIFVDTNLWLLVLTFFVSALHLLFDVLAFKNDISFWRHRKTMVGLSTKALLWRAFSQSVIVLYLMDQQTSLLVLVPAVVGVFIEIWKVSKAFKMSLDWSSRIPRIRLGAHTAAEEATDAADSQAMKVLGYFLVPLCIGGAIYSLAYVPHTSWRSWALESAANGVYAFGFLFMLPQLFVNYRLKSVAHLPWRAFMYKAFNTFIDDLFAFIIVMPTSHRVACFRDDVVFLVYLFQRYLYPVDRTRVNEFGESFDDVKEAEKQKSD